MGPKVCSGAQEEASQEAKVEKPQAAYDLLAPMLNRTRAAAAVNQTWVNAANATAASTMGENLGTGVWMAVLMAASLVGLGIRLFFIFRSGIWLQVRSEGCMQF